MLSFSWHLELYLCTLKIANVSADFVGATHKQEQEKSAPRLECVTGLITKAVSVCKLSDKWHLRNLIDRQVRAIESVIDKTKFHIGV